MTTEAPEDKVDLVAKEIELTKLLASNDPKTRSEGIKQIKQLLLKHSGDSNDAFQLNDYLIIWRGLFYFMWMSDKPLPQESASEKISNLFHCCTSYQGKTLFLEAFFLTIKDDWMSISQHRIDKFMMLVRRCIRQVLFTFVNCNWNLEYMQQFNVIFYKAIKSFTLSLRSHIQEIFLEELAKVSRGKVPSEALIIILDAFLHYISELNDTMAIKEVVRNVFRNLLSQSTDLEMLEAKFQAWKQMGKPGKSYNDLELVEGDIAYDDLNDQNSGPLDPRAGNVSIEIPRIKFNPKDVSKLLKKYVSEVDCTRKCLVEITKLMKWYNRLGEGILPYKPKELKLNSQVLNRKKKKHLSKMVKEGVKKLEMVDSKIKKSSREVSDLKSLKELDKMGEIIVEHGKVGKSVWKVRKFDENSALKENISLNESWTVSDVAKNDDVSKLSVCNSADDEIPLLVPAGFSVDVSPEKAPINDSTPSLKLLIDNQTQKESSSKKRKSPKSKIDESINKNNIVNSKSPTFKNDKLLNISNTNNASDNQDDSNVGSASKKLRKSQEITSVKKQSLSSVTPPKSNTKSSKNNIKHSSPNVLSTISNNNGSNESSIDNFSNNTTNSPNELVISKIKQRPDEVSLNTSLNKSWSVCSDEKLNLSKSKSPGSKLADKSLNKSNSQKSNSPAIKNISIDMNLNNSLMSAENNESASKKVKSKKELMKAEKRDSLSSVTPDKNTKSPKSPKSPTPEQRVLRRRTIIIPKKKPEDPNNSTPKRKSKESTGTKTAQKRRKTIAGEEITISMLKPDEISNKALEKVRSEAFDDGLGTPRKSSRLSIKTDSAKKRVEFQLRNNIEQEFMEYRKTLKTKKDNPHDASKQPEYGVLKSTPDANRINPFYKISERSAKKNSRKSII